MSAEAKNVHAPATNPQLPPVSERQHPDQKAGKYAHPAEIDCPACKAAKATSLGFVEFTNKGGNTCAFAAIFLFSLAHAPSSTYTHPHTLPLSLSLFSHFFCFVDVVSVLFLQVFISLPSS